MTRIYRLGATAIPIVLAAVLAGWQFGGAAATAAFQIVANQTAANAGQNFNGASHGHLVVTVPEGAQVRITFLNKGSVPHSLQIIPYTDKLPATALARPVFPGAETPNPQAGVPGGRSVVVHFTASKPGKYLMICGFPGHALLGMYGIFQVSPSAAARPSLVITK